MCAAALVSRDASLHEAAHKYWGPCGDWSSCVGLTFHPRSEPEVQAPITITFNDLSVQTLT